MNDSPVSKGDILIVDDTPDNLRFLSAILSQEGYDVRSVTTGSAALMGIQSQQPDLVLLDVVMPGMNGYTVCQQLKAKADTQHIPVIFISALDEIFDKVRAFSVGGVDYITKPFQSEDVLVRIETQLTVSRLQTELRHTLERERALNLRVESMEALEERHRIAREIHDSLGHLLVALNIQLESALALWEPDPEQAYVILQEAKQLGTESLEAVRQSVSDMRVDPLQGKLLEDAIAKLVSEFRSITGIRPECDIQLTRPLSQAISATLFRVLQEGLTNICKHAHASTVSIRICTESDYLSLVLKDDGQGFDRDNSGSGFGLQGMQERMMNLGGSVETIGEPGMGCQVIAHFPYQKI
jgi:two-component system, sensor histidine kinase and response regulator